MAWKKQRAVPLSLESGRIPNGNRQQAPGSLIQWESLMTSEGSTKYPETTAATISTLPAVRSLSHLQTLYKRTQKSNCKRQDVSCTGVKYKWFCLIISYWNKVSMTYSVLFISTQEVKRLCELYPWCITLLHTRGIPYMMLYNNM